MTSDAKQEARKQALTLVAMACERSLAATPEGQRLEFAYKIIGAIQVLNEAVGASAPVEDVEDAAGDDL